MKILLTGGSGFLGHALVDRIVYDGFYDLTVSTRQEFCSKASVRVVKGKSLAANTDWGDALREVDVVIHTAAVAHVTKGNPADSLQKYRTVNVDGTLALVRQAIENGVKRFIYISSIGVNGSTTLASPFTETSLVAPHSSYAISKFEAEEGLKKLCEKAEMEFVIIRPPLIYAAHAPGSFLKLLKAVSVGIPLPFRCVFNRKSFIALENLVDFIVLCIKHPAAANEIFLISDEEVVSTPDLLSTLAEGMGKNIVLLPFPVFLMRGTAKILGKKSIFDQLCGSLEVDSRKARSLLNWVQPYGMRESIKKAGREFSQK